MADGMVAGTVAVVTGAGQGMGRGIAMAMATEGARVVLVGRTRATLAAVAAELEGGRSPSSWWPTSATATPPSPPSPP